MSGFNYIAIDFETATRWRGSICEIGIAVVKDSKVVEKRNWLVQPDHNIYDEFNIYIHGITPEMTKDSPLFKEVWNEVLPYLDNSIVVAHNASFDIYALRDALEDAGLDYPTFEYYCSYRLSTYVLPEVGVSLYNHKLDTLCNYFGIKLETHHRAGDDAVACAEVFAKLLQLEKIESVDELQRQFEFLKGKFCKTKFSAPVSYYRNHEHVRISDIVGDPQKIDESSYFYGKRICLTGSFMSGTRSEILQKIADLGGIPTNSVTKTTDVLIVGQQDYRVVGESGMSTKQKKAVELHDAGGKIEILDESDMKEHLNSNYVTNTQNNNDMQELNLFEFEEAKTFTIIPSELNISPDDCVVTINKEVFDKPITIKEGDSISWKISKVGYETLSGKKKVTSDFVFKEVVGSVELKPIPNGVMYKESPLWAECNLGASSKEKTGLFFAWGNTEGNLNASEIHDSVLLKKTVEELKASSIIDENRNLTADYDAASMILKDGWRLPKADEIQGLIAKCDWEATSVNGVNGLLVKGKNEYQTSTLFFPLCGIYSNMELQGNKSCGGIWSATITKEGNAAKNLTFFETTNAYHEMDAFAGTLLNIRPVKTL